ncbi:NAD-dependent succinate-semialdehyde dehydrogenase [Raineyella sp. W15-4]|uniref:NAD-dependent succinate-semialdehyde dehydrogenase n=1 Tax=Raineyella sp. W15-4 TaxID=3081651 RepID=UPI0029538CB0|nr:NAD-dependent succinate-semialdehyde dehydrogenase [Raineyella sp. W15-4]WOQ18271.1 NAD-dependent succinate-semialdehyde dehydrogenase [Raineyella sp. W15-4]
MTSTLTTGTLGTVTPGSAYDLALQGRQYIGGEWRAASDGASFPVEDPGRAETIVEVADGTLDDCLDAVTAADEAAAGWAATPPRQRAEILRRSFDLMIAQKADIARLITLESGKAYGEALGEVDYAAEFLRWFSEEAVRALGNVSTAPSGDYRIITTLHPVGVSLFVTPWNFPAAMATRKIGPALAAGCTTVLRPAKETPLTVLAMARVFEQAGVPAGVVNVVTPRSSSASVAAMMADKRVRKISFTGSTGVGKILLEQAARRVLRTSMELGGNAPFIVLEDADLDVAVNSAMVAKLRNGGQSCTAANRFYVHEAVEAEFSSRFAEAMSRVTVGHGLTPGVELGAMVTGQERDGMLALIQDAHDRGATVAQGGDAVDAPGHFLQPTLLRGVPLDARAMEEEIFGPVAPVATFTDIDDVIARANSVDVGLVSFVQTRDIGNGLAIAERLESGMVGINRGKVSDPAAPFGGWKESGVGKEGGHEGLLEYLESKYTAVSW